MGTTNADTETGHQNDEASVAGGSIESFFANAVILVTGATGFLGKALLEKLLRSCPRLGTIYVLIRAKKGQSVEQRHQELMDNPVFNRIRWEYPGNIGKVIPVKGDVAMPDLGLSPEDRAMLTQRVTIVFHSAATVRFDEPLKVAVNLNTRGTERMVELCKSMENLVSFVHVSTAYSNADQKRIREAVYTTRILPQAMIEMCENLDDETLALLEKRLIGKHPNTYTLTKGLAEQIVSTKGVGLPIAIVRPSIVCAAYQEPFPGWVDNVCGITGIMMEIGRGTIRSIVCNADLIVDVVPVDQVVNTLISAAWHNVMCRPKSLQIYNCTSGSLNPIRWSEFGSLTRKHAIDSPTKYVMWYPGFTFRTNKFIHKLLVGILHFLPAFIIDLVLRCQGGKPIMMKITRRFEKAAKTGEFFAVNEWLFEADNMKNLVKDVKMTSDANEFNVDMTYMDWDAYVHQYMLGIRKYILKDSPDTLTKARSRLLKLYWAHRITQAFSVIVVIKMIASFGR
ncbi:putative fatty acyl-CoA reductase CG5065 [Neodiprion pinetum]|uniref:Fatty acyl-CoA reductase n=1 Tax=Neodiprion lecontei TaxID=441921 RepID=A0ABM3FWI1_NEOLC|nr:putative fatty acyl-CoA reductase CG5065 [Neodiprion fabricii]XP_046420211.1 putative fatty acyl-CoA reductase CG5065 [Neodiprion fabricii]XP_046420212.1 putative fatty acyl-CoA reductase CG5065 [Neodiprion fabricii]XP_046420213.1 putative fatty acyl-CoA reductase CG5065 [Neodiprion fabricii]XP_046476529.1 putative fatty acyl-CoA reductase CG5065 [Neodiprion pinetum]XP_046476530.1 putative fatty acyl-CoA reductase CG5065 [Neodiprion pinetum]XP_046476531.1 putative fatty acyl-CoA reductase 